MKTELPRNLTRFDFDLMRASERVKTLILARAGEWNCSPQEALKRILEMEARKRTQSAA